ncbi:uncharacterized protein LOC142526031 [Primulina tabacum]|uniref:uncharacterized protein LOC142526031 n=1 Tax=Primulina tabacum TaxID=48773 RepID=UPI003F595127
MSGISWNARGLENQLAFRELKRLVAEKSPTLPFICETKMMGFKCEWWKHVLGFDGFFVVDSKGRSGGLMLLWRTPFNVSILSYSSGHIDCSIQHEDKRWRFTGFYGHPESSRQHFSWDLLWRLGSLSELGNLPWLVGGDFNEICFDREKSGGNPRPFFQTRAFRDVLEDFSLQDLHGEGEFFTLVNRRSSDALILARLDRFVASFEWRLLYPASLVQSLEFYHSDHRSILLELRGPQQQPIRKHNVFRFEPHWITEFDCKDVIERGWCKSDSSLSLPNCLLSCKAALRVWAGACFNNLPRQIKRKRHHLNLLKSDYLWKHSEADIRELEREVEKLAHKEELYWRQRSRVSWLAHGDRNSKFFHARAFSRRAKNHIRGLVSSHGDWCTE